MTPATMEDEVIEDQMTNDAFDVFETDMPEVPSTPPDVHRGTVTGVTLRRLNNDKQTSIISIGLVSKDVPTLETSLDIFVPKGWEESVGDPAFKATTLPNVEGNKQYSNYVRSIANSERTASLQKYVFNKAGSYQSSKGKEVEIKDSIARAAGRNPAELGLKLATNLETYVDNLNAMLQGIDVLFTRRERGGDDPAFAHQLQVREIFGADEYDLTPKKFKSYVCAWGE